MSQQALADAIGKSLRTVQNWEAGERVPKNPAMIRNLAQVLKTSVEYLTGEQSSPINYGRVREEIHIPNVSKRAKMRMVPVVSWASAGVAHDYGDLEEQIDEQVECETKDVNAFALIAEGDSMEREIMAGDRIIFEPNSEPRNNDIVVARLNSGGVMVKRFRSKGPDIVILESNREEYKTLEIPRKELRFIYPAIEIIKRLRR